jgi:hypothetical protein
MNIDEDIKLNSDNTNMNNQIDQINQINQIDQNDIDKSDEWEDQDTTLTKTNDEDEEDEEDEEEDEEDEDENLNKNNNLKLAKGKNKMHLQPKPRYKGIDYVKLCDDLIEKVNSDKSDCIDIVDGINQLKSKLSQLKQIGENFLKKDLMTSAFALTAKNMTGFIPYTKSEYDRKIIECNTALADLFADGVFGNPISTNVIFIFEYCQYHKYIMFMEQLRYTTSRPKEKRLVFGSYRLDQITKNEIVKKNTPNVRYQMIMTDIETNISIKVICVKKKQNSINTRVEQLDISGPDNIFESIADVCQRKIVLSFNLAKAIGELSESMERKKRAKILGKVCEVLSRDIELLDKGYSLLNIGKDMTLDYAIEKEEVCYVTHLDPPYVKINLECGHALSIMALYGMVYKGESDDTESIVCPKCRKNLIPKMINIFESVEERKKYYIKIYKKNDLEEDIKTHDNEFTFEENKMITQPQKNDLHEAKEFIDALFEKKQETENEDDDESIISSEEDYDEEDYDGNGQYQTQNDPYNVIASTIADYMTRNM